MKENIADNVRTARKEKGLSGAELASMLGLSHQTIYRWENGRGYPDISQLELLSEALSRPPEYFLRGSDDAQDTVSIRVPREYAQEVVRFLDLLKKRLVLSKSEAGTLPDKKPPVSLSFESLANHLSAASNW